MDKNVLVAFRIEAGRNFLDQLYKDGLDVYVAFWAKSRDAGSWYLYVATAAAIHGQKVAAYEQVFASLSKLEHRGGRELELTFNDMKVIEPSNPLARAAVYIREVNPRNRTSPPSWPISASWPIMARRRSRKGMFTRPTAE